MIGNAVACDRPNCLGFLLEPSEHEHDGFEAYAIVTGWTQDENGHACPACVLGTGPVSERGACPACGGRIAGRSGQDECLSCERVLPSHDDGDGW